MSSPTPSAPVGPAARALLVWMRSHPERLRLLLDEAARDADDLSPAGDAAIRAHLSFVAEALAANAAPGVHDAAAAFAARAPAILPGAGPRLDAELRDVGEAHAFEVERQFGADAGEDPAMRAVIERRVRVGAWLRVFLAELDAAGATPAPVGPRALAWMADHQVRLADTIFAMDRAAKLAEMERDGPDAVATAAVVNRIGQAAMVQAHMRFLVEAITGA